MLSNAYYLSLPLLSLYSWTETKKNTNQGSHLYLFFLHIHIHITHAKHQESSFIVFRSEGMALTDGGPQ
jgi:hypothetical protein